jgi:tRNA A37 N6-isopentenylltransferase MiaA
MKEKLFKDICRFARKQISWLKNKEENLIWITNKKEAYKKVKEWLNQK